MAQETLSQTRGRIPSESYPLESAAPAKRDLWSAMWRGFRCNCPNCGEGKLFRAFLKVKDRCEVCDQNLSHHRADDLPAYLVIVIVGHIVVPIVLAVETNYSLSYIVQFSLWLPLTFLLSIALLQPVKGAVVGLQWAFRMHGFGEEEVAGLRPPTVAPPRG